MNLATEQFRAQWGTLRHKSRVPLQPVRPHVRSSNGKGLTRLPVLHAYDEPGSNQEDKTIRAVNRIRQTLGSTDDTNLLQTALAASIAAEDYQLATLIRDRLQQVMGGKSARIDWSSLDLPAWLIDRLERLGYKFPTEVQRRAAAVLLTGCDAAIRSETGSGKTLSFLVPLLARLQYPPEVFTEDLKGPQAILVVPTMELGVQTCLLAYRLLGGSINHGKPGDTANMFTYTGPKGILVRGVLNREEVLMAKETAYLAGTHLVVTTPSALTQVVSGEDGMPILDHLRVLCIDEFDECLRESPEATMMVLSGAVNSTASGERLQVVLVGATLTNDQVSMAADAGWVQDPVIVNVGRDGSMPSSLRHRFVVCDPTRRLAVLVRMLRQDLKQRGEEDIPTRGIIFANSAKDASEFVEPLRSALWMEHLVGLLVPPGSPLPTPVPGSFSSEQLTRTNPADPTAADAASHELAGSTPFSATDPIRALLAFRDNKTSLLLCTPQAARGLDLPAVSHVYSVGCPSDSTQYLHRAGRAGRIGSTTGGTITTIVTPDELPALTAMLSSLGLTATEQEDSQAGAPLLEVGGEQALEALEGGVAQDVDKLRKGLEDIFTLM